MAASDLFQFISDIHLENCRDFPLIQPTAKYLFLAGDIGHVSSPVWRAFMDYLHEHTIDNVDHDNDMTKCKWQHIFYVLGNHEFYSNCKTMPILQRAYHEYLSKYRRITLLDRDFVMLPSADGIIAVLGTTLWPVAEFSIVNQINDFRRIHMKADPTNPTSMTINITPAVMNKLHIDDKNWLFGQLIDLLTSSADITHIIILSHFPLTQDGTSDIEYSIQKQAIKNYYANEYHQELVDLCAANTNIKKKIISISGHTHFSYDFTRDGIQYLNSG